MIRRPICMYMDANILSSNRQFNRTIQPYHLERDMLKKGQTIQKIVWNRNGLLLVLLFNSLCSSIFAQGESVSISRDSILVAARDMMILNPYCALITTDKTGRIEARTMNPFAPDENMIVWFATNRQSRKVEAIKNNPQVCLYYAEHDEATGYVSLTGIARIVDDKETLLAKKREYWEGIPNWQDVMVLIEIIPQRIDIIYYKYGLVNGPDTWQAPFVEFESPR
jgi:general stress protein 26